MGTDGLTQPPTSWQRMCVAVQRNTGMVVACGCVLPMILFFLLMLVAIVVRQGAEVLP